ncbi:MAG: tetratricopeptide repeat protein [Endomicrobia bacterium]|nr:tetratricopeptide repeat protein [Endomicrobiia bacterium]
MRQLKKCKTCKYIYGGSHCAECQGIVNLEEKHEEQEKDVIISLWKRNGLNDNFSLTLKNNIRTKFDVLKDEEILYVNPTGFFDGKDDISQGCFVTDKAIYIIPDNDEPESMHVLKWTSISKVDYKDLTFYFYGYQQDDTLECHISHIVNVNDKQNWLKVGAMTGLGSLLLGPIGAGLGSFLSVKEKKEDNILNNVAVVFAGLLTETAKLAVSIADNDDAAAMEIFQRMENLRVEQKWDLLLKETNELPDDAPAKFYYTAWVFWGQQNYQEALKQVNSVKIDALEEAMWKDMFLNLRGEIYKALNKISDARKDFLLVSNSQGKEVRNMGEKDFKEMDDLYSQKFLEMPYIKRKVLVPVEIMPNTIPQNISVLSIENLSLSGIHFSSIGHPIENEVYIGHPFLKDRYIPFKDHELELINDKIREFCEIMQTLGATEVKVESINFKSEASGNSKQKHIGVNETIIGTSGAYDNKKDLAFLDSIKQSIAINQSYRPTQKPFLPNELYWYHTEPSWQRLYRQRMQGSLEMHNERFETSTTRVLQNSELTKINAELKLFGFGVGGEYEGNEEQKLELNENVEVMLYVKFAPIDDLK